MNNQSTQYHHMSFRNLSNKHNTGVLQRDAFKNHHFRLFLMDLMDLSVQLKKENDSSMTQTRGRIIPQEPVLRDTALKNHFRSSH